ncbi:MAG TPA: ABC transporter ATP-binding protein [Planctomycetota bacterium]|nr:ABC transporter ATP-binding protein [Planctomycetota bacterium]
MTSRWAESPFAHALSYFPRFRRPMVLGLLCVIPSAGLDLATMLVVRDVFDGVTGAHGAAPMAFRQVLWWSLLVMLITLVKGAFKYGMRYWVTGASREFERVYRQDLFDHLVTLTPHDLAAIRTGDIMSRSVADIEAVRMFLGPAVMYNAQTAVVMPLALVTMALIDWQLTAVMLVPFIALALVVKVAAKPTQHWSHLAQERLGDLSTVAQENFSGIRVVKAFVSEAFSRSVFQRMGRAFLDANVRLATVRGLTSASISIVKDVGMLVIVLLGGWHLVQGRLTLGDFLLFSAMLNWALWPLIAVGWTLGMYHRARAGAVRLNQLFALQPSVRELPGAVAPVTLRGELEVRHLTFGWGATPVLHDVSLRVPAGATLGITGRTGCGKSTLVQLLSRQVEPPPGTVFLDGRDVRELPLTFLRRSIGVVPQDSFLFSESIASNIGYARDEIDLQTVRAMAAAAHVDADIEGFPHGYDELLGERGVTLSGGQRQRTAIARTLAADPPVIILDDCLSAVDTVTEQAILRGLRETLRDRTAVIVSHRVAALSLADRILVLDEGAVVEEGTHEELVARGGLYAEIHERQRLEAEIEAL